MARAALIWGALAAAIAVPLWIASTSPLLAWREPVYVAAGLAGVVGLACLLLQPLLATGALPGLGARRGRRVHRAAGVLLIAAILVHVGGLWVTSPPDVVDALLLRSPTPFSPWGVAAMWAAFAAAVVAVGRRRLRPATWRRAHLALGAAVVGGTAAHALLIEGTMGTVSKAALCLLAVLATAWAAMRGWRRQASSSASQ
ncbi:ferric reductase-like transmembrane domain-containing protein [Jannaschia sp. W003]|uniref:ferric reductase-like transmembrane domain-containing protein n=1 Tax=Jannaschia sp. W003 TaxID=2867012 RepID=UPI0021A7780B|nr:ferric reductase-like transmembrane domain-containing protein [Jannaschia sp. W003]UWQ20559.1 ferric reductase-like transmembrane domain-containing protein [Jannaschia sp. W003]